MNRKFQQLEAKLTMQQRKAALLLVQRELDNPVVEQQLTIEDIAVQVGISERQMYRWKRDPVFIEYMNMLADDFLSGYRSGVYKQMLKLIFASQPSVKAMDLYLKRFGLLTDRTVTETADNEADQSDEKIAADIEALERELADDESGDS
jgi:hypothetical protein